MPQTLPEPDASDDPFLWLEEVHGERALAWVRERNAESQQELAGRPDYAATYARLLALLNSRERIPHVVRRGDWLYNLWQDETHKRGLWRRTTLAEYRAAEPAWQTVLDLDALALAEGENWVWGGAMSLGPEHRLCLVSLSRGGADAKVVREFDLVSLAFVAGGFTLAEAKSDVEWIDADSLYVGTDFGPGSLTDSGYPRVIKRWARGTPLADAVTVFEGDARDVAASVSVDRTQGFERTVFSRAIDFFHNQRVLVEGDRRTPLDLPEDASFMFWNHAGGAADTLLIELRSDLAMPDRTYPRGSLLAIAALSYLQGRRGERDFKVLFEPTATRSLAGFTTTREHVMVNVLDNVASKLEEWRRTADHGFVRREIAAPHPGTLSASGLADPLLRDDPLAEHYLLSYADFLTPDSLLLGSAGSDARERLKSLPAGFDASGMRAEQWFATSPDGTRIPYFVVWPPGSQAGTPAEPGGHPALLYGYGGFEISMQPFYAQAWGSAWIARGGVLVVANIRGGGEFGPAWHQAALKANRQRSYDDFIAVAVDLIARRITSPPKLGIAGGSNGGLLVGAVMTQRPELFNAVVCQVPLLDMKRFHKLLAGASWMAEYGNPDDPAEWAFISKYSPYQNLAPGTRYPKVLFTTSTRDDRVHPGHARKMAARMRAQGHALLYYENIEGGHGGAADNEQRAHIQALEFSYLWQQLAGLGEMPRPAVPAAAQAALDYWFGAPGDKEYGSERAFWFRKSDATDREIAARFAPLIEQALRGELADWAADPRSAVAQILLLDQFTRNVFRDTPRAFAGDAQALAAASAMVGARQDEALLPVQRGFVYLPFEHAERMAMQDESVRLFTRLVASAPEQKEGLGYAHKHRDIVARFGRFPHRNAILGRQSTLEELAFLQQPGSSF